MNKITVEQLSGLYDVAMALNSTENLDGRNCCQKVLDAARIAAMELYGDSVGDQVDTWVIESSQWDKESLESFAQDAWDIEASA